LEAQPCLLESQGQYMLCITSVGMMHIWYVYRKKCIDIKELKAPYFATSTGFAGPDLGQCLDLSRRADWIS
jgi:TUP1-like enhancer of split